MMAQPSVRQQQSDHGLAPMPPGEAGSSEAGLSPEPAAIVRGRFTPGEARQARRLAVVIALVGGFFVVELVGALLAGSVVLQADAVHLLMDVLALSVSLAAMHLAVTAPTAQFTYGLRRAEPVAAIFSAALVLVTTGAIVVEGIQAFEHQSAPKAGLMLVVAIGALVVNGLSAWLLHDATLVGSAPVAGSSPNAGSSPVAGEGSCSSHHGDGHPHRHHGHGHHAHHQHGDHRAHHPVGHRHDDHAGGGAPVAHGDDSKRKVHGHALNLRGAWLHLAGDTLGALGALGAAIFIRCGGSPRADPVASFVVAGILLVGSVRLVRDATMVLLEAAPQHLPLQTVRRLIAEFPGVREISELHVWTLGAGHDAITVRVSSEDADFTLAQRLSHRLRQACGAEYVTVQVESGAGREAGRSGSPVANRTEPT